MLTLNDGRSELWQWDTGRTLTVDADCSQVHFSNKVFGRSIDVDVVDGVAIIPDILLQTDKDLNVWAFVGTAENGYTKISKTFKVNRRNKPTDYVFTPPDQTSLEEIKEKLDYLESIQDPDAIKNAVEDYLEKNPVESPVQSVNGKTGKVDLTAEDVGAISQDKLQEATNEALAQAKASGAFNGAPGNDYVLTEEDKAEIAEMAAELVDVPDSGGNVDLTGVVRSVNGQTPDENGNVEISVSGGSGGGLSSTASALLITILRNGVYNTNQSANITALENALKNSGGGNETPDEPDVPDVPVEPDVPEVTLSSISVTYTGGDVPAGTSVLALSGIVVTAHYSDGSSKAVEDYELSGEIGEGNNTVTVNYGGMTATFTVTGIVEVSGGYTWLPGYFKTGGSVGQADGHMYCEEYFPAIPDKYFYIYNADATWNPTEVKICFYDSEKNYLSRPAGMIAPPSDLTGTLVYSLDRSPENAAFARVSAQGVSGYENSITITADCPKPYIALEDATWAQGNINNNGNFVTNSDLTRYASSMVSVDPGATYSIGNSNPECNMNNCYTHLFAEIWGAKPGKYLVENLAEFTVPEGFHYIRISLSGLSETFVETVTLTKIS